MKKAVCVIITSKMHYFAVSRRNDTTQWGFPGGKVDPGESHCDAIIRETREEIGFTMQADQLVPIYSGNCEGKLDGVSYWVTTYLYLPTVDEAEFLKSLTLEEGLTGKFATGYDLCCAAFSPFNFYNDFAMVGMDEYLRSAAHPGGAVR